MNKIEITFTTHARSKHPHEQRRPMHTHQDTRLLHNARTLLSRRLDPLIGRDNDDLAARISIRDGKLILPELDLLDAQNLAEALTEFLPHAD